MNWYKACVRSSWVFAGFSVLVMIGLLVNLIASRTASVIPPTRVEQKVFELNLNPQDEALRQKVLAQDLAIRQAFFRARSIAETGLALLAFGAFGFLVSLEAARRLRPSVPIPKPDEPEAQWMRYALAQRGVWGLTLVLGGGLAALATLSRHDTVAAFAQRAVVVPPKPEPEASAASPKATPVPLPPLQALAPATPPAMGAPLPTLPGSVPALVGGVGTQLVPIQPLGVPAALAGPTPEAMAAAAARPLPSIQPVGPAGAQRQWAAFRGYGGWGLGEADFNPDMLANLNVAWKTPVALPGWGSPVVWDDRVYLHAANQERREVYAFDLQNGRQLWSVAVPLTPQSGPMSQSMETGYAPATPVTDGNVVVVCFVNADVAGVSVDGRLLWQRSFGPVDNKYGHSSSLAMAEGLVFVQVDHGYDAQAGVSRLYALDAQTGRTVWEARRLSIASWAGPVTYRLGDRTVVVAVGNPAVEAYDAKTGEVLWRTDVMSGEVAPGPGVGEGLVVVGTSGSMLSGLRADTGEVLWQTHEALMPDIASKIIAPAGLFVVSVDGTLSKLDPKTGRIRWEDRLPKPIRASPIWFNGRVLVVDQEGTLFVVDAAEAPRRVAERALGESVSATPAVTGANLLVRTQNHLICLRP